MSFLEKLFGKKEIGFQKRNILIIDSDYNSYVSMKNEIERTGVYMVTGATTGKEGIRLSRRINPDIIFVDWEIENPGGGEVLYQIKRIKRTASVPLCLIINGERALDYELARISGIKDYMTKPFSVGRMLDIIREKLN